MVGAERVHNTPVLILKNSASSAGTRNASKILGRPVLKLRRPVPLLQLPKRSKVVLLLLTH